MERKPATAHDISLVVAAADVVGRYASQNPMTKMELAIMIAEMHALLVERVDAGPRVRIAAEDDRDAKTTPNPKTPSQGNQIKSQPTVPGLSSAKPDSDSARPVLNKFRDNYVVAEPQVAPFLPIEASVWSDKIVCLECGKSFSTLKRHLLAVHKTNDIEYRKKFGLSGDYPMICDDFEVSRRKLMQAHGAFKPLTKAQRRARSVKPNTDITE